MFATITQSPTPTGRTWRRLMAPALALGLMLFALPAQSEIVIITSARGSGDNLSREQATALFLGKATSLPGFGNVILMDQPESSALRDEFYSKLTGRSATQVKASWAKIAFTGKGMPPREKANSIDVRKSVASTPGAIGYIEKAALDASVKILLTVE